MRHFVQYHGPGIMGPYESDGTSFGIQTDKAVDSLVGGRVWLITSEAGRPRSYFLCETFIVEHTGDNVGGLRKHHASGSDGRVFLPRIRIDHMPWFREFLRRQANFSRGLTGIDDEAAGALERCVSEAGTLLACWCVYTIVSRDALDRAALERAPLTRQEGRAWRTATRLLDEAGRQKAALPILIGDAKDCSRLLYWGILVSISVRGARTTYTVDALRPIPGRHSAQELVLRSSGKSIAPRFIRPYAVCRTPTFLESSLAKPDEAPFLSPEEGPCSDTLMEGAAMRVTVNAYERNAVARAECIAHYGARCLVCGIDFAARYGEIGQGFIHVHHLTPLAAAGDAYVVDPVRDLRPVCPNCHAMLHRENPPLSVDALVRRMR